MKQAEIQSWLRENDPARLEQLWLKADAVRRENAGQAVHLRGLIEFSNFCVRRCAYCGIRSPRDVSRYRMTEEQILSCAFLAHRFGYGTVVLQAGQDPGIETEWMSRVIKAIKSRTPMAVTLSLGERSPEELAAWREAGADRYLLRFETSNPDLYRRIHPSLPGENSDRIALLRVIQELGYETGSGVMAGIPGQSYEDLARDIKTFEQLDLDMVGIGPFLPHPDTPLGRESLNKTNENQVPATDIMACKVIALTRLVCPRSNIPSTTALATINRQEGRLMGLQRGANVVMPNVTPEQFRVCYEIYPEKAGSHECAGESHEAICRQIKNMGREIGTGRGDAVKKTAVA